MGAGDLNFSDPLLLENVLYDLRSRIETLEQDYLQVGRLDSITQATGDQRSGTYFGDVIAPADGVTIMDPTDPLFSGYFIVADGADFGAIGTFHSGGVHEGVLEFGIDYVTGKAYAGGGSITLDSTGEKFYNGALNTLWLQPDGDIFAGSDLASPDTTYFALFTNAQTYNGESLAAGSELWGSSSDGKSNMLYDPVTGNLYFRSGKEQISSLEDGTWHVPWAQDVPIRYFFIPCIDWDKNTSTGDGKGYFVVPPSLDGKVLVYVNGVVGTAGTTNSTILQIANETKSADMLSIQAEINSGGKTSMNGIAGVVDSAHDDVTAGDILRVDIDQISTTPAKGLGVIVGFYNDLNQTCTLQPDAAAGMDNEIVISGPDINNGTGFLIIGTEGAAVYHHTLIQFDFSTIPSNAIIVSAVLSLTHWNKAASQDSVVGVWRLLKNWTEMGSTWNRYNGTNTWESGGGLGASDFDAVLIGSRAMSVTEDDGEKKWILNPSEIQDLIDGTMANHGFIMRDVSYVGYSKHDFRSSDYTEAAERPKLVIEYYVSTASEGPGTGDMLMATYDPNEDGIIAIAQGGTGAGTAALARDSLGLAIGTNIQAYDATLASIASLGTAANKMLYTTGADVWAEADLTAAGRAILDDANATAQRTTLGLGGAAILNVGTTAGTVAAGDDNRFNTQGCRVYAGGVQATVSGTPKVLAFDHERYDTDAVHDNVTNNSRLTCKTAGKYMIGANIEFASIASTLELLYILLNGETTIAETVFRSSAAASTVQMNVNCIYDLAVNDYVQAVVLQTSGGNININSSGNYSPEFWMQRIG